MADNVIPKLVQGIKGTMNNPDSVQHQLALISAAQDMITVCTISFLLIYYATYISLLPVSVFYVLYKMYGALLQMHIRCYVPHSQFM